MAESISTAGMGNATGRLGLEVRRALNITLCTRHQIPANGSAVTVDSRDDCSLGQDSFGACGGDRHRRGRSPPAFKPAIDVTQLVVSRASVHAVTARGRDDFCRG